MSFNDQTNHFTDKRGWNSLKKKIYSFRSTISRNEETIELLEKEIQEQRYQQTRLLAEKAKLKELLLRLAMNQSELANFIETDVLRIENEGESPRSLIATTGTVTSEAAIQTPVFVPFSESINIMKGTN